MNQNDLTPADQRDQAHSFFAQAQRAERANGVLRAANAHLRKKQDDTRLKLDEARAVIARLEGEVNQARNERDSARESYRAQELALDSWIVGGQRRDEEVKTLNGAIRILNGRLDAALLQRDEARESVKAAVKQRDALEGIVHSLHQRAVRATEALGVVYGPADAE